MSKKNIPYIEETYDVVVVGAGHAGCEAAAPKKIGQQAERINKNMLSATK